MNTLKSQIICIKFDIVIASIRYTTQSLVLSISIQISEKLNQAGFTSPPPPRVILAQWSCRVHIFQVT